MNVKAIMQYLGKCRREISELANVRGEKSVSYWFDYLWCAVRTWLFNSSICVW